MRRKTGSSLGESSRVTFTCGKAKTPRDSGNLELTTKTSLFTGEFVTSWISQERLLWESCDSPESCTLPSASPTNHPRKWAVKTHEFGILGVFLTLIVELAAQAQSQENEIPKFAVHLSDTRPKLLLALFHMIPSIPKFPEGTGITQITSIWARLKWTSLGHCRMKGGSAPSPVQGGDNSSWSRNEIFPSF